MSAGAREFWDWVRSLPVEDNPRGDFIEDSRGLADWRECERRVVLACPDAREVYEKLVMEFVVANPVTPELAERHPWLGPIGDFVERDRRPVLRGAEILEGALGRPAPGPGKLHSRKDRRHVRRVMRLLGWTRGQFRRGSERTWGYRRPCALPPPARPRPSGRELVRRRLGAWAASLLD